MNLTDLTTKLGALLNSVTNITASLFNLGDYLSGSQRNDLPSTVSSLLTTLLGNASSGELTLLGGVRLFYAEVSTGGVTRYFDLLPVVPNVVSFPTPKGGDASVLITIAAVDDSKARVSIQTFAATPLPADLALRVFISRAQGSNKAANPVLVQPNLPATDKRAFVGIGGSALFAPQPAEFLLENIDADTIQATLSSRAAAPVTVLAGIVEGPVVPQPSNSFFSSLPLLGGGGSLRTVPLDTSLANPLLTKMMSADAVVSDDPKQAVKQLSRPLQIQIVESDPVSGATVVGLSSEKIVELQLHALVLSQNVRQLNTYEAKATIPEGGALLRFAFDPARQYLQLDAGRPLEQVQLVVHSDQPLIGNDSGSYATWTSILARRVDIRCKRLAPFELTRTSSPIVDAQTGVVINDVGAIRLGTQSPQDAIEVRLERERHSSTPVPDLGCEGVWILLGDPLPLPQATNFRGQPLPDVFRPASGLFARVDGLRSFLSSPSTFDPNSPYGSIAYFLEKSAASIVKIRVQRTRAGDGQPDPQDCLDITVPVPSNPAAVQEVSRRLEQPDAVRLLQLPPGASVARVDWTRTRGFDPPPKPTMINYGRLELRRVKAELEFGNATQLRFGHELSSSPIHHAGLYDLLGVEFGDVNGSIFLQASWLDPAIVDPAWDTLAAGVADRQVCMTASGYRKLDDDPNASQVDRVATRIRGLRVLNVHSNAWDGPLAMVTATTAISMVLADHGPSVPIRLALSARVQPAHPMAMSWPALDLTLKAPPAALTLVTGGASVINSWATRAGAAAVEGDVLGSIALTAVGHDVLEPGAETRTTATIDAPRYLVTDAHDISMLDARDGRVRSILPSYRRLVADTAYALRDLLFEKRTLRRGLVARTNLHLKAPPELMFSIGGQVAVPLCKKRYAESPYPLQLGWGGSAMRFAAAGGALVLKGEIASCEGQIYSNPQDPDMIGAQPVSAYGVSTDFRLWTRQEITELSLVPQAGHVLPLPGTWNWDLELSQQSSRSYETGGPLDEAFRRSSTSLSVAQDLSLKIRFLLYFAHTDIGMDDPAKIGWQARQEVEFLDYAGDWGVEFVHEEVGDLVDDEGGPFSGAIGGVFNFLGVESWCPHFHWDPWAGNFWVFENAHGYTFGSLKGQSAPYYAGATRLF